MRELSPSTTKASLSCDCTLGVGSTCLPLQRTALSRLMLGGNSSLRVSVSESFRSSAREG